MTLKILTIDDDPSITKLIKILLGSYGMDVITANSGKRGLELTQTESPDLVLLDMMMPEMSGLEVCRAIRTFSDVPIVIFSALGDPQEIAKALKAGCNAYLEKPSSADVMVDQIHKLTVGKS